MTLLFETSGLIVRGRVVVFCGLRVPHVRETGVLYEGDLTFEIFPCKLQLKEVVLLLQSGWRFL